MSISAQKIIAMIFQSVIVLILSIGVLWVMYSVTDDAPVLIVEPGRVATPVVNPGERLRIQWDEPGIQKVRPCPGIVQTTFRGRCGAASNPRTSADQPMGVIPAIGVTVPSTLVAGACSVTVTAQYYCHAPRRWLDKPQRVTLGPYPFSVAGDD